MSAFLAGVARRMISPPWGVELAGWGYDLGRVWTHVRDELAATALVVADDRGAAALVAVDLMYNDAAFTGAVRDLVAAHTGIPANALCVACSHTHNGPTAGLLLGGGERDPAYLAWAARQAATACVLAWRRLEPARLFAGRARLPGLTVNRTREGGPVDEVVSVLRVDGADGRPLAAAVNFHAHPIVHTLADPQAVSRDWPGEVVDIVESTLPGATALYLQGTCGDVNFLPAFVGTARRPEPARAVAGVALQALARARPVEAPGVAVASRTVAVPTRRWTREEVIAERAEAEYRLRTGDTTGWLDGIARVCVGQPHRLPERYGGSVERAVEAVARFTLAWTDRVLPGLETRPERLDVEVQALRVGDVCLAAHPAELFTTLGLALRERWPAPDLFVLGYANGSVGYMPDAYDVERRTYAAYTSPKATDHLPFTAASGPVLIDGIIDALAATGRDSRSEGVGA